MVKEYKMYKYLYNCIMPFVYMLYIGIICWTIFTKGINISILMAFIAIISLLFFTYVFKVDTFLHICLLLYYYIISLQQLICYTFPEKFISMGQWWYVADYEIQNVSTCIKYNFLLGMSFVIMVLTEIIVSNQFKKRKVIKIAPLGKYTFDFNPFILIITFSLIETLIILLKRSEMAGIIRLSSIGIVYYLYKSIGLLMAAYTIKYICKNKFSIMKCFFVAFIYGFPYLLGGTKVDFVVCFMGIIFWGIISESINLKQLLSMRGIIIVIFMALLLIFCMRMRNGANDGYGIWNLLNRVTGYLDGCKCIGYINEHGHTGGGFRYVSAIMGKSEGLSSIYTTYIFGEKISGHAFAIPGFIAAYMYGGLTGIIVYSVCIIVILCVLEMIITLIGTSDIEKGFISSFLYVMVYVNCIWDGQIENWKVLIGPILAYAVIDTFVRVGFGNKRKA